MKVCRVLLPTLFLVSSLAFSGHGAGLDRHQAEAALSHLWKQRQNTLRAERTAEMTAHSFVLSGKTLRWVDRTFGSSPSNGPSLWISLHGGGGAPAEVNDQQWTNQIRLYTPKEGIYVAPRAPTDNWNLWHEAHIDPMFDRLIEDYIVLRGVDPDHVYVLGYSAGGDGVWQIGPRMADRWAAAAMMAGHPNEASLLSLRNLPFAVFVGGRDAAYDRNRIVAERAAELDRLEQADPGGYPHMSRVYPESGHWMNRQDAEALPWMAARTRNPWPGKIVWFQDDVTHVRFYWLAVPRGAAQVGRKIVAEVQGQTFQLSGDVPDQTTLRLSDELLNLDRPIQVLVNSREVFSGRVERQEDVIRSALEERADPRTAATASLRLKL